MDELIKSISDLKIESIKTECSLKDLARLPCVFQRESLVSTIISKFGDLLIGFIARENTSFELYYAGDFICAYTMKKMILYMQ